MNVNMTEDKKSPLSGLQPNFDFINKYGTNPIMIGILLLVVVTYYFVIYFSVKTDSTTATSVSSAAGVTPPSSKPVSHM